MVHHHQETGDHCPDCTVVGVACMLPAAAAAGSAAVGSTAVAGGTTTVGRDPAAGWGWVEAVAAALASAGSKGTGSSSW